MSKELNIKILVVEDDESSRFFLNRMLKTLSDNVFVAVNGQEGYEIFEKEKPNIVITDIAMPVMDGLQMTRKIKAIAPETEIILTTAFDDKSTLLTAIELGVRDFLIKPIKKQSLINSITRIFDQLQLKEKVQQQYDRIKVLSSAIEQSSSIVIITDPLGNIEYANNTFYVVTGFQQSEIIDRPVYDYFMNAYDDINYVKYKEAILNQNNWRGELQGIKETDNTKYWTITSITPILSKSGKVENFVQVNEDITDLKKIQQEISEHNIMLDSKVKERTKDLEKLNADLLLEIENRKKIERQLIIAKEVAEKANNAKSSFLAKVSHELRTPMNGIIGMSGFLSESNLNEKQKYYVDIVKKSANTLLLIINDILDISKLDAGKFKLEKEYFNPNLILDDVVAIIGHKNQNIEIIKNKCKLIPDKLWGDPFRLQQILLNLVSNAIKFTEKGFVKISANLEFEDDSHIELLFSVEDTGIGIKEEDKNQIFKMFTQVEKTMTRKRGGTGLGLVISKEIVEMMGGQIWFKSTPDKGSVFYFTVILDKYKNAENHSTLNINKDDLYNKAKEYLSDRRILIADDSKINRKVLSLILDEMNISYDEADNGNDALELFYQNQYDLLFLDWQMPGMDGLAVTDMIRKVNQDTVIIAVTAHSDSSHKTEAISHGINTLLAKPYTKEDFLNAVNQVYSNSEISKQALITPDKYDLSSLLNSLSFSNKAFSLIVNYFLNNYLNTMQEFNNYLDNDDFKSIEYLAHRYKSEVAHFNALEAVQLLSRIEKNAKMQNKSIIENDIKDLFDKIQSIVEYLKQNKAEDIINYYRKRR